MNENRRKIRSSRRFSPPYDIGESPPMSFENVFDAGAENLLRMTNPSLLFVRRALSVNITIQEQSEPDKKPTHISNSGGGDQAANASGMDFCGMGVPARHSPKASLTTLPFGGP
jgi:hypothetical protein